MNSRIIEVLEISQPQSTILREGAMYYERIHTHELIKELNKSLNLDLCLCNYNKVSSGHIKK